MKILSNTDNLLRHTLFTGIWLIIFSIISMFCARIYMDITGKHPIDLNIFGYIIMFVGGAGCGLFSYALLIKFIERITIDMKIIKEKYK